MKRYRPADDMDEDDFFRESGWSDEEMEADKDVEYDSGAGDEDEDEEQSLNDEDEDEVEDEIDFNEDEEDTDEQDDEDNEDEELLSKFIAGEVNLPGGEETYDEFFDPMEKTNDSGNVDEMEKRIEDLESMMRSEKPWQLRGEVKAEDRYEDALLEEILDFDSAKSERPIMSEEVEEKIKRRVIYDIKNGTFQNVEKRKAPAPVREEFRRQVVNSDKPKPLSQVYEEEFKASQMTEKREDPAEETLRKDMLELLAQLDALSNNRFAPRMPVQPGKLVKPAAAVTLEETIPTAVSSNQLLTPKDIVGVQKQPLGSEITKTDRRRFLKKKKKRKGAMLKDRRSLGNDSQTDSMRKVLRMSHKPQSNVIISDKVATMWGNKVKRVMKSHGGRKKRKNENKSKILE